MLSKHMLSAVLMLTVPLVTVGAAAQNTRIRAIRGGRYDAQIEQQLDKKFHGKKDFQNMKHSVEDGVVTLTGTVELYAHKMKADEWALNMDHVQSVSNGIKVGGATVSDAALREKLADKLRYDGIGQGIMFNSLKLGVQAGVAEIGGTVIDETSRVSAIAIAANTPGVKGVRDEIEVAPPSFADDELRLKLARAIYGQDALFMYGMDPQAPIRIVVNHSRVTLEGVVNSEGDRTQAYMRAAQVPGSFSVTNHLVVAGKESPKS